MTSQKGKNVQKIEAPTSSTANDGIDHEIQRQSSLNGRTSGPTRRSTKGQWTAEEDEILCSAVKRYKGKNWKKIGRSGSSKGSLLPQASITECLPDRTDVQCLHRWQKVLNPELVKGPWSKEEDEIIVEMVKEIGLTKWSTIAQALPGRIGKQCRERWHNHLNPAINREPWTQEEEIMLIRAHQIYGNKWAELTKFLPGRSDNSIKNHWNCSVKKKLNSYLASGLLSQFQGRSYIERRAEMVNEQTSNGSCRKDRLKVDEQTSNGSCRKDRLKVDDTSDYIQTSSANIGLSQSDRELAHTDSVTSSDNIGLSQSDRELTNTDSVGIDVKMDVYGDIKVMQDSHLSVCTNQCSPEEFACEELSSMRECALAVPEVDCDACTSADGMSAKFIDDVNLHELQDTFSLEVSQRSLRSTEESEYHSACITNNADAFVLQSNLLDMKATTFLLNDDSKEQQNNLLTSEIDCCSNNNFGLDICGGIVHEHPSEFDVSDFLNLDNSFSDCQNFLTSPPNNCVSDVKLFRDSTHLTGEDYVGTQDSEVIARSYDDYYAYSNICSLCPCGSSNPKVYLLEDTGQEIGTPIRAHTNAMVFGTPGENYKSVRSDRNSIMHTFELQDSEALFYDPSCFPSLEVPFVTCDLIPSVDSEEYSPLGIRQLMASSLSCSKQDGLWDSPSHDELPNFLLKSDAKSFMSTPSVMKKRQREFSSPTPEERTDQKSDTVEKDADNLVRPLCSSPVSDAENTCMVNVKDEVTSNKISLTNVEGQLTSSNSQQTEPLLLEDKENLYHSSVYASVSNEAKASTDLYDKMASPSMIVNGSNKFVSSPSRWRDIGHFVNPGDRSYDAIGLMRQLSEHSSAVISEAQEVLRSRSSITVSNELKLDS